VSRGDKQDRAELRFIEPDLFVSASGEVLDLGDQKVVKIKLPKQFPEGDLFDAIGSTAETL